MTGKGKETEFKFRVDSQGDLDAVAKASGATGGSAVHQENHFFDTPERLLDQNKYVLRLRQENSTFFLTAKGPSTKQQGTLTEKAETEREITSAQAAAIREGQQSVLAVLAQAPLGEDERPLVQKIQRLVNGFHLVHAGSFSNERLRLTVPLEVAGQETDVTLELDRTTFPGEVVHYEVEVEVPPTVDAEALGHALTALFERAQVKTRHGPGKAKRFFAAMRGEKI
ncbi:MAG: CYTH domain-containing protein [Myxococcaceae bacterium]|nr:CYTH domain-containing protein [Myxococcaceae bacterium]